MMREIQDYPNNNPQLDYDTVFLYYRNINNLKLKSNIMARAREKIVRRERWFEKQ